MAPPTCDCILAQNTLLANTKTTNFAFYYDKLQYPSPLTPDALRILIKKAYGLTKSLANQDEAIIMILDRSIINNYKDIYPLENMENGDPVFPKWIHNLYPHRIQTVYIHLSLHIFFQPILIVVFLFDKSLL